MRYYLFTIFFFLSSCKKDVENSYFVTDEIYSKIIESTSIIHNEISKKDGLFYVINRYDTLIVISAPYENVINPTFKIKKRGTFYTKCCKIIVTEPYRPSYNIFREPNKLKQNDVSKYLSNYDGAGYQKGVIYKIRDINHLEFIAKGDLRKYFYPIDEYELKPPPAPAVNKGQNNNR